MAHFITQEIGSIQRPIWRQNLDAPSNKDWIKSALEWGERFGVEERAELANDSGTGLLQKNGRERSDEEKQRIIEVSSLYVIRMLEHAGLDRVFNGEQPRTEMYDTLASRITGIRRAGFLNSFDANYFRKGETESEVMITKDGIDWFIDEFHFVKKHAKKTVKPCLTGPYTMADWSYIEYYRKSSGKPLEILKKAREEAVMAFARNVLNPIVRALAAAGAEIIQIDEPAAATYENESALFTAAINESFRGVPDSVEKAVHLCYSNYSSLFPELAECVADSYLIESTNHTPSSQFRADSVDREALALIDLFNEHKMPVNIGVGVVDIHSDVIESPEVIRDRVLYAAKLVGDPSRIQVNPDCGLRTRRWEITVPKLANMVKGAQMAREAVE